MRDNAGTIANAPGECHLPLISRPPIDLVHVNLINSGQCLEPVLDDIGRSIERNVIRIFTVVR